MLIDGELRLNMRKLNGLIVKKNTTMPSDLFFINWSYDSIWVLNIPFGNCGSAKQLFKKKN